MIPVQDEDAFERSLSILNRFGSETNIRGRFVALYLGLRLMGDGIAVLGSSQLTPARNIEDFLDSMYLKTHVPQPLNVLTALFGGSPSPNAPWSTGTGRLNPRNQSPTNTWRNNFNIQKGIGCPASATTIRQLLDDPSIRRGCSYMSVDSEDSLSCTIAGTRYRGEEHSIWLRSTAAGYQVADLNDPATYRSYFAPDGRRIPIFPLIAALYSLTQDDVYPDRDVVGVPEFAQDFGFSIEQVEAIFDLHTESRDNRDMLKFIVGEEVPPGPTPVPGPQQLPTEPEAAVLNTGVGAELAVARDLQAHGWAVRYVASVPLLGYDLETRQMDQILRIEVKSAFSTCTPELTDSEWRAAQEYGDEYILAVVEFFGSEGQSISYVRNPAAHLESAEIQTTMYRFNRAEVGGMSVDATFL